MKMLLDRNQGMVDRIFMMEGYTPLGLARFIPMLATWNGIADLMNAKFRVAVNERDRSMSLAQSPSYLPRASFVPAGVIAGSADEAKAIIADTSFDPRAIVVLEREFLPADFDREWSHLTGDRASAAGDTLAGGGAGAETGAAAAGDTLAPGVATITSYRLNAITLDVQAPADGFLLLSEVFYPGWNAYVDGAPGLCLRADWCLRVIPLRAGSHKVEVRFEPGSFATGAGISIATLVLASAGLGWTAYAARRKRG
jgi:hypothetical protein